MSGKPWAGAPAGATTYGYDGDGNQLSSSAGEANTYNPLNQTASMTAPTGGSALSMTYTGIDSTQRITIGGTGYVNTGLGISASQAGSNPALYFTRDPSGTLNSVQVGSSGARYYYLYNGTGSVIGLIDSNGNQVAAYAYDPYSTTLSATGTQAATNPFRYQGDYTDPTGYIKFGTRYYNPALGSWTQLDPSGMDAGYDYAGSNPANESDQTGLCSFFDCIADIFDAGFEYADIGGVEGTLLGGGEGGVAGARFGFLIGAGSQAIKQLDESVSNELCAVAESAYSGCPRENN